MRWKTNVGPQTGDKRVSKFYAYLPTELDDGYTVWLEDYYVLESYDDGTTSTGFPYWKPLKKTLKNPLAPDTGGNRIKL